MYHPTGPGSVDYSPKFVREREGGIGKGERIDELLVEDMAPCGLWSCVD